VATRVVALPDGEDPDSFVRGRGAKALDDLIAAAMPAVNYFLDQLWFRTDRSADARAAALREAAPLIAAMPDRLKRDLVIDEFARGLDVDPGLLRRAVSESAPAPAGRSPPQVTRQGAPPPDRELNVISILADHPDLLSEAEQLGVRSLLTDDRLRDMYSRRLAGQSFLDAAPADISDLVAQKVLSGEFAAVANPRRTLQEAVRALRRDRLVEEDARINRAIKDANRVGDNTRARELILKQMETRKLADELSRRPEEDPR
jgi:DNA primase